MLDHSSKKLAPQLTRHAANFELLWSSLFGGPVTSVSSNTLVRTLVGECDLVEPFSLMKELMSDGRNWPLRIRNMSSHPRQVEVSITINR